MNLFEHQLIASGRLVSLGEVSASMAHEFNNPLGIIMGFVEDMMSGMDPTDPNYRSLLIIDEEAKRCRKIVRDLMEFARPTSTEFRSISVPDALDKTLQLVENRLYKQEVTLEKEISAASAMDPGQFAATAASFGESLSKRHGRHARGWKAKSGSKNWPS